MLQSIYGALKSSDWIESCSLSNSRILLRIILQQHLINNQLLIFSKLLLIDSLLNPTNDDINLLFVEYIAHQQLLLDVILNLLWISHKNS
jgi:hypothetical protein